MPTGYTDAAISPARWYEEAIVRAQRAVEFAEKHAADEATRTVERNDWNAKLRASVPMPDSLEPEQQS